MNRTWFGPTTARHVSVTHAKCAGSAKPAWSTPDARLMTCKSAPSRVVAFLVPEADHKRFGDDLVALSDF
jgi:hypothetical protein